MASALPQHYRLATTGRAPQKLASGGAVLKTGLPTSPITDSKRANGIPGACSGGSVKSRK